MSSSDPQPSAEARTKKEPTKGEQIYDAWLTPTDTRYLPDMIDEAIEEAREKALAWADAEVTATRASEARMLRRLEEANAAGREREREALERAAKALDSLIKSACGWCDEVNTAQCDDSGWWFHFDPRSLSNVNTAPCRAGEIHDAQVAIRALGDRSVDRAEGQEGKREG